MELSRSVTSDKVWEAILKNATYPGMFHPIKTGFPCFIKKNMDVESYIWDEWIANYLSFVSDSRFGKMSRRKHLMLVVAIFLSAIASASSTLLMRYGGKIVDFSGGVLTIASTGRIWIAGIMLGWLAGLAFSLLITRMQVTALISLYMPLSYLLTFMAAIIILKESVSWGKIVACVLLTIGLYLIAKDL
jgi:hypothetical protein